MSRDREGEKGEIEGQAWNGIRQFLNVYLRYFLKKYRVFEGMNTFLSCAEFVKIFFPFLP